MLILFGELNTAEGLMGIIPPAVKVLWYIGVKNAACGTFFNELLDNKYQWMSQYHLIVISFLSLGTIYSCFCPPPPPPH